MVQPALLVQATGEPPGTGQFGSGSPWKQPVPRLFRSRQKPQKMLFWPLAVLLTAVTLFVPVTRSNAIGRPPMLLAAGGGQSWLVGKLFVVPRFALSAGVQAFPSFGPP